MATRSNAATPWKGFKPIPYLLDYDKAWNLPLTLVQAETSTPTTLGQIYSDLKDRPVEVDDRVLDLAIATESKTLVVTGSGFARQFLQLLLTFRQEGINGFESGVVLVRPDRCTSDPQQMHDFVIVHKEKIVRDQVSLCESSGRGFDPTIFSGHDDSEPTWFNEKLGEPHGFSSGTSTFILKRRSGS